MPVPKGTRANHDDAPTELLQGGFLRRTAHTASTPRLVAQALLALAGQAGGRVFADVEIGALFHLSALGAHLQVIVTGESGTLALSTDH